MSGGPDPSSAETHAAEKGADLPHHHLRLSFHQEVPPRNCASPNIACPSPPRRQRVEKAGRQAFRAPEHKNRTGQLAAGVPIVAVVFDVDCRSSSVLLAHGVDDGRITKRGEVRLTGDRIELPGGAEPLVEYMVDVKVAGCRDQTLRQRRGLRKRSSTAGPAPPRRGTRPRPRSRRIR